MTTRRKWISLVDAIIVLGVIAYLAYAFIPTDPPPQQTPSWQYWVSKNEKSGRNVHHAHFRAGTQQGREVEAWVECKPEGRGLDVIFEVEGVVKAGDLGRRTVDAEYRFDHMPVRTTRLTPGYDGKSFHVLPKDRKAFIEGMKRYHTISLRIYDFQRIPWSATIPLNGTAAILPRVVEACS